MKRFNDLTSAEKAKHTKLYRKLDAEREAIVLPYRDAFLKVAEPLWEERNAKIDAEQEILSAKIDELKKAFQLKKQQIIDEYDNHPEYKALNEVYEAKNSETFDYVWSQMIELEKSLGLR